MATHSDVDKHSNSLRAVFCPSSLNRMYRPPYHLWLPYQDQARRWRASSHLPKMSQCSGSDWKESHMVRAVLGSTSAYNGDLDIPFKSKHIYICGICQWQAPTDGQFQPPVAGGGPGYQNNPMGGNQGYPPKPQ
ncbi:hypothetical protein CBS101457_002099 [Exobasidium rhododendri]|nr:hypothetical protein CBS101457_002099 [Exobasidium rhododendri]